MYLKTNYYFKKSIYITYKKHGYLNSKRFYNFLYFIFILVAIFYTIINVLLLSYCCTLDSNINMNKYNNKGACIFLIYFTILYCLM